MFERYGAYKKLELVIFLVFLSDRLWKVTELD